MQNRPFRTARTTARLRKSEVDWYRIENKASDTASVYLYDEIGYFGITAKQFITDFAGITARSINLHLNSPGGDVFDGVAIYNAIKAHPANVTCVVDGLAASAASFIAQAADKVVMTKNAEIMIHDAFGMCLGNAADMTEMARNLDRTSDNIASIYAEKCGGTKDDWRTAMKATTWYSAEEAVKAGLADEVAGETTKASNRWDMSIFNYGSRADAPEPFIPTTSNGPVEPEPFNINTEAVASLLKGIFA